LSFPHRLIRRLLTLAEERVGLGHYFGDLAQDTLEIVVALLQRVMGLDGL